MGTSGAHWETRISTEQSEQRSRQGSMTERIGRPACQGRPPGMCKERALGPAKSQGTCAGCCVCVWGGGQQRKRGLSSHVTASNPTYSHPVGEVRGGGETHSCCLQKAGRVAVCSVTVWSVCTTCQVPESIWEENRGNYVKAGPLEGPGGDRL